MNALLTVEDFGGQPVVVEYVGGDEIEATGEDLDTILTLTVELDVEAAGTDTMLGDVVEEPSPADGDEESLDIHDGLLAEGEVPVFDDEFPIIAVAVTAEEEIAEETLASDPRLTEMQDVLVSLRGSEVGHALRLLRQRFPHIPFPFRVRALMAVRHGAVVG